MEGETYGATNDPAQRVPGSFVEPVEELVKAVGGEVVGRSVVEPGAREDKGGKGGWERCKITTHGAGTFISIYRAYFLQKNAATVDGPKKDLTQAENGLFYFQIFWRRAEWAGCGDFALLE